MKCKVIIVFVAILWELMLFGQEESTSLVCRFYSVAFEINGQQVIHLASRPPMDKVSLLSLEDGNGYVPTDASIEGYYIYKDLPAQTYRLSYFFDENRRRASKKQQNIKHWGIDLNLSPGVNYLFLRVYHEDEPVYTPKIEGDRLYWPRPLQTFWETQRTPLPDIAYDVLKQIPGVEISEDGMFYVLITPEVNFSIIDGNLLVRIPPEQKEP